MNSYLINEINVPTILLFSEDVNIAPVMPFQAVQEMTTYWQQPPIFLPPIPSVANETPKITSTSFHSNVKRKCLPSFSFSKTSALSATPQGVPNVTKS